ncbi:MAG TPA: hypothetical protein PKB10_03795 [Tepidisphaeraceae bacterium]|nr:hypothetical protein [Tepidisphaeraceae bacterium]
MPARKIDHAGLLKVGYTEHKAAERVAQQFPGGFTGYDIKLMEPDKLLRISFRRELV